MVEGCMIKFHMNNFFNNVRSRVIVSCLIFLNLSSAAFAEKLLIGTGEFPPYVSENLNMGGPLSQIVAAAFAKSDIQVELDFIPWNRAFKLAESMRIDATFPWAIKSDKKEAFIFSKPLFIFEHKAFALKNKKVDLSEKAATGSVNLCRPQGYTPQGLAKKIIANGVAIHFSPPNVDTCFNMLKAGRVDIVVVDKLEGQNYVAKIFSNVDDVKVLDTVIHKYSNHLLISKGHPQGIQLIKDFDYGLDKLMESGEYQEILFEELGL